MPRTPSHPPLPSPGAAPILSNPAPGPGKAQLRPDQQWGADRGEKPSWEGEGRVGRTHRSHHSKSQRGVWASDGAGVKVTAFRTTAWISRVTSMLLESQVVLEEQGGFGNSEKGSSH